MTIIKTKEKFSFVEYAGMFIFWLFGGMLLVIGAFLFVGFVLGVGHWLYTNGLSGIWDSLVTVGKAIWYGAGK